MKLSIVLSTQPTSFSAILYNDKLEESIDKMKELGYDGVEFAVRDPSSLNVDTLKQFVKKNGLEVSAIGTGQAFLEEGLSFTDEDPNVRKSAIERIKSHIDLAVTLNSLVIIGLVRGRNDKKISDQKIMNRLTEAFHELWQYNPAVKLAIEPINRYETNIFNTVREGLDFINALSLENVGLLLDTFHMNIEEPSIIDSFIEAKDNIFHVHFADSNRWYPGAGHIDFKEIVLALTELDYQEYVSAEILPLPDQMTASVKSAEYLRKLSV